MSLQITKKSDTMDCQEKYDRMTDILGADSLNNEIIMALDTDKLEEILDFVARMYDISFDDDME